MRHGSGGCLRSGGANGRSKPGAPAVLRRVVSPMRHEAGECLTLSEPTGSIASLGMKPRLLCRSGAPTSFTPEPGMAYIYYVVPVARFHLINRFYSTFSCMYSALHTPLRLPHRRIPNKSHIQSSIGNARQYYVIVAISALPCMFLVLELYRSL